MKTRKLNEIIKSLEECNTAISESDSKLETSYIEQESIINNPERKHDYEIVDEELSKEIEEYRNYFEKVIDIIDVKQSDFLLYDNYVYESIKYLCNNYKKHVDLYLYKTVSLESSESKYKVLYSPTSESKEVPQELKELLIDYSINISKLFKCFSKASNIINFKSIAEVENKH